MTKKNLQQEKTYGARPCLARSQDCRELQRLDFEPALIEERLQGSTSRGLKTSLRMASSGDAARK